MKALSINWYKIPVLARRILGISLLLVFGYWLANFFIKFLFFFMYVGVTIIDKVFRFLINLF